MNLLESLRAQGKSHPVTLPQGSGKEAILEQMKVRAVRQIPLVDDQARVMELAVLDDLVGNGTVRFTRSSWQEGSGRALCL